MQPYSSYKLVIGIIISKQSSSFEHDCIGKTKKTTIINEMKLEDEIKTNVLLLERNGHKTFQTFKRQ